MLTNSTSRADGEQPIPAEIRSCTVVELRDMLQEIQVLAEKLSISLSSERHYNHKMFFTLTDTMTDGVLVTDANGKIRVTSSNALQLMNVDASGLNGRHILECFPDILSYWSAGTKTWTRAKFNLNSKSLALDVIVSKIELEGTSAQIPGSNCIILLKQPLCRQSDDSGHIVDKYALTSNISGDILHMSTNMPLLLRSRPQSLLHMRNLIGAELFNTFSSGDADLQNVDVSSVNLEVGDLDLRLMVAYKTNVFAKDSHTDLIGYALTLLDISADVQRPAWLGQQRHHVAPVKMSPLPSALVQVAGWKPLYCNAPLLDQFGLYAPDLLERCIFATLLDSIADPESVSEYIAASLFAGLEWVGSISLIRRGQCVQSILTVSPISAELCSFTFKELT